MRMLAAATTLLFTALTVPGIATAQTASPTATAPAPPTPGASASPAASASPQATASSAASDPGYDRIDTMWKSGPQESWFSQTFLTSVPFSVIGPVLGHVKTALGTYVSTAKSGRVYICTFSGGTQEVRIHFDTDGKIDGLFLPPPRPAAS